MTTVMETIPETTRADYLGRSVPVDLIEDDGQGQAWLNLSGEWLRITTIKNLWDMDGQSAGGQPSIRMHFRAITEDSQQISLFQDLMNGAWYRQVTLNVEVYNRPTPIYRA